MNELTDKDCVALAAGIIAELSSVATLATLATCTETEREAMRLCASVVAGLDKLAKEL